MYLLANRWILTVRQRAALEAAGIALVIASITGFDASSSWPGWRALVPVLGAVGILLAARSGSGWTGNPVAQWLGTRSYSLYLWHWPIVVALTFMEWQADPFAIAGGLALTLVMGNMSYWLVETPARVKLSRLRMGWGATALLGAAVAVATPGTGVLVKEGVPGRFSPEIEIVSQEAVNFNPRREACHSSANGASPSCMFGGSHLQAIVTGDSHANGIVSSVVAATLQADDGVMELTHSGCPTLKGVHRVSQKGLKCDAFVNWTIQKLKSMPPDIPLVVLNNSTSYVIGHGGPWVAKNNKPEVYFNKFYETSSPAFLEEFSKNLVDTACYLSKDRPVYLVRPMPGMDVDVPKAMSRAMTLGRQKEISISLADYHQRHAFIWAAQDAARDQCGVKILDPLPYLCWDGRCHCAKNGRPLFYDGTHLSEYGNKLLVPMFAEVFQSQGKEASHKTP